MSIHLLTMMEYALATVLFAWEWRQLGQDVVLVAAILTAIGVIIKKWMDVKKVAHNKFLQELRDTFDQHIMPTLDAKLDAKLEPIRREMEFNGGSTVKDKVCKLDETVGGLVEDVASIKISTSEVHKIVTRDDVARSMAAPTQGEPT